MWENQSALIAGAGKTIDESDDESNLFVIIPETIKPEVLWACTTCSACEEECPVFISYIDKIVALRQHLAMERGEFPEQLATMFQGLENAGNPYSYPNDQRADWAEGLDVRLMSDNPEVEYLYWVGCAASFDDRSRKIARAFAQLLQAAGVKFAILGPEETCNGDPARRAGNEFLFQMLAQQNIEVLNNYNVKRIVTACPHCYNTLKHEYPDFGGKYEVIHHSELLARLVRAGKLKPQNPVHARFTYHDACYLGRHNQIYDAPREILQAIPGIQLVEPDKTRDRGMCCGAGGAQMWKEEEEGETRVNHARTRQLAETLGARGNGSTIASSCPFCKTMLCDGLADLDIEGIAQLDIAEILWESVATEATETDEPAPAGATA
jgi:Fe-S oxidoreductase